MFTNAKRIAGEMLISILILWLFFSGAYALIPAPMQLLAVKMVFVSVGVLHAHAAGKLLFPKVSWTAYFLEPAHYVRISLYIIIPVCYAFGG